MPAENNKSNIPATPADTSTPAASQTPAVPVTPAAEPASAANVGSAAPAVAPAVAAVPAAAAVHAAAVHAVAAVHAASAPVAHATPAAPTAPAAHQAPGGREHQRGGGRDFRGRRDGRGRFDQQGESEFVEKIIAVNRVSKTVKGGRHFGFSVLVCVGDQKGRVGIALGKAKAVPDAVRKGLEKAKKGLITVPMYKGTIPHPYLGKFGASSVMLRPAAPGTGVIAGGAVRAIFEALGVKDILSKRIGSNNPVNVAKATLDALKRLRGVAGVAKARGLTPAQVIYG